MPNINWLSIAEKLGIPATAMAVLFAMLHYDLISPMNSREERHLQTQEKMADAVTAQTEILRGIAYDTKFGTYRIAPLPPPESVPAVAPPPPKP